MMNRYLLCITIASGLFFQSFPMPGYAADPPDQAELARTVEFLSRQAIQHYRSGDYRRAITLFQEAYDVEPVPNLLYNIAKCHEQLEEWEEAITHYTAFTKAPDVDEEAISDAQELIAALDAKRIAAQQERKAREELAAKAEAEKQQANAETLQPPPEPARPNYVAAYATLGTGAALLVGGGLAGWVARGHETTFNEARDAQNYHAAIDARDSGTTWGFVADGMFISGGLLTAVGTYLYFTAKPKPQAPAPSTPAQPAITPWVSADSIGIGFSLGY